MDTHQAIFDEQDGEMEEAIMRGLIPEEQDPPPTQEGPSIH
nr:hypothetical protein Q903MT_gene6144 [Picea sitchensis]